MFQDQPSTSLRGWHLTLARLFWIIAFLLCSVMLLALVPVVFRLTARDWQVTTSYRAISTFITFTNYVHYVLVLRYFALAICLTAALIIFWRKSNDWIALLASATLVLISTAFFFSFENLTYYSMRWAMLLENMSGLIMASAIVCLILFFNLFPDGKLALRGMSTWITLSIVIIIILIISMYYSGEFFWGIFITTFIIVLLISVYAQVYRYRHLTNSAHRQQIKWVLFAFTITAGGFLGMILLSSIPDRFLSEAKVNLINLHASLLMLTSIPISMSISIFRYRLWDIDVIIRRTLVYGSLSATLLAVYLIGVVLFQSLVAVLGVPQSEVGIVISTLVIATLFNPLRRRIQLDIDHRFYREKYDAAQALARFAAVARDETDLDVLNIELVRLVQETIQPETISLWIREPGE
jgi:hypothetical protein